MGFGSILAREHDRHDTASCCRIGWIRRFCRHGLIAIVDLEEQMLAPNTERPEIMLTIGIIVRIGPIKPGNGCHRPGYEFAAKRVDTSANHDLSVAAVLDQLTYVRNSDACL